MISAWDLTCGLRPAWRISAQVTAARALPVAVCTQLVNMTNASPLMQRDKESLIEVVHSQAELTSIAGPLKDKVKQVHDFFHEYIQSDHLGGN